MMQKLTTAINLSSIKCSICKNSNYKLAGKPQISSKAAVFINKNYYVIKCNICRFYYVFPEISLNKNEWEKLYESDYFSKMPRWWARKRHRDRKQRLDWLEEHTNHKIKRFLDIGCGEGYVLVDALKRGWNAHGIDIYDNRVNNAKNRKIAFYKGDIFQATFPNDYFDCIYMDSMLEHIQNPLYHLREIKRILCKGGSIYIGVPNEDCLFNTVKRLLYILSGKSAISAKLKPFMRPYHVIGFTEKSLTKVLIKSGFEIVKLRNFAGEYEWRKFGFFTKPFLVNLFLLPVHLVAIPFRKRIYLDAIVRKKQ